MSEKTFYDIHCHALNLSHPSLLAFVKKLDLKAFVFLNTILGISTPIAAKFVGKKFKRAMNLLALMEYDIGDVFLKVEEEIVQDNKIQAGGNIYDRVILTPLMMDFGMKDSTYPGIHYSQLSRKPIEEQVTDLFNGIRKYKQESTLQKLEIYPFLGINTQNYTLDQSAEKSRLDLLFDKYFLPYKTDPISIRREKLMEKMGTFTGKIDELKEYSFAGLKLYPPLGFDPWPDNPGERAKVAYVYQYCIDANIPVTAHCSDGGYDVHPEGNIFTAPDKWSSVLNEFRELKLNLAHFGKQKNFLLLFKRKDWQETIIKLIDNYQNVYTDFSCFAFDTRFYEGLRETIENAPGDIRKKLKNRILFGTDFMINLLWTGSYKEYFDTFAGQSLFNKEEMDLFSSVNPENFLFPNHSMAT